MTLIEVVVGVAVMTMVFFSLFGAFRISIELIFSTKAKTGAVALMTERIEYIRSLPYASVGTVGGIPPGVVPQVEQMSLNGIVYTVRTIIQYTDAPEDGLGVADSNAITADYKTVKVEVLWNVKDSPRSTFAVTRVAPSGIETLEGGGTLNVNVLNSTISPVEGATVHIVNNTTNPVVDVSVDTNTEGTVSFPGAPEAGGYEITVTKTGYSSAQTYTASSTNPNPSPAHIAVLDEQTTSISFFIDTLGSLFFRTYEPIEEFSFLDPLTDLSMISQTASTSISGGALVLDETSPAIYEPSGSARSISILPPLLTSWGEVSFTKVTPGGTTLIVQIYYFDGSSYSLIPDADLPGNSAGFSAGPIDVSGLATTTYTQLQLGTYMTSDTSATPRLAQWSLTYYVGPTPLPNVSFQIHGSKTIGTNGAFPVYKRNEAFTTDTNAEWQFDDVEWDTYSVDLIDAYDIAERCPNDIVVSPGANLSPYFYLAPDTTNSIRVYVADTNGPVSGAQVTVSGSVGSANTSGCGQVYFGGITGGDYTVTVSKTGYQTEQDTISILGDIELVVGLTP